MNFDSMEYFSVLARERSFTRAAELLHITQQSLSSHIAGLEKELNCQLVVRRVPLELTFAGQTFLRYAEDLRRTQHAMEQEFCDITENQKGELRVGVAFTRGRTVMPRLIAAFQEEYPQVQVTLVEDYNDALLKLLSNGNIDLAVADLSRAPQEVERRTFYEERMTLCLSDALLDRCGIDLAAHEDELRAGDLSSLRECPFVLGHSADIGGRIGRELLRRSGVRPVIKAASDNLETLLALCELGVGACFSPENLVRTVLSPSQLRRLHLARFDSSASYPISFGYLKRSYQWSVIEAFIRVACAQTGKKEAGGS